MATPGGDRSLQFGFTACKYCFGKERADPSNLSDYDVNACGYYRLPADSYAAIDMGEPEVTPAMHAVIVCADWRGDQLL